MVDLGSYKDKFGDSGQRILDHALSESRQRDQNFVSVEHILEALMHEEPDMFNSTMRELSLDPIVVKIAIDKRLDSTRQQHLGKGIRISPDTTELFKRAMERARAQGRSAQPRRSCRANRDSDATRPTAQAAVPTHPRCRSRARLRARVPCVALPKADRP